MFLYNSGNERASVTKGNSIETASECTVLYFLSSTVFFLFLSFIFYNPVLYLYCYAKINN